MMRGAGYLAWYVGGVLLMGANGGAAVAAMAMSAPADLSADMPLHLLPDEGVRVEKVVMLMRHGGRLADDVAASRPMQQSVQQPVQHPMQHPVLPALMPDHPPPDALALHTQEALKLWGQYHRQHFSREGLLPVNGELPAGRISAYAGPVAKAFDSARGFLDGLVPGNTLTVSEVEAPQWFRSTGEPFDHTPDDQPRYLAARHIAPLLSRLSESLLRESEETVSLFVGHESTVASVRAALGFDQETPEQLRNHAGPGGMLMFERIRRTRFGDSFVRVSYHVPLMNQLRYLQPLTDAAPPFIAVFHPSGELAAPGSSHIPAWRFKVWIKEIVEGAAPPLDRYIPPWVSARGVASTVGIHERAGGPIDRAAAKQPYPGWISARGVRSIVEDAGPIPAADTPSCANCPHSRRTPQFLPWIAKHVRQLFNR